MKTLEQHQSTGFILQSNCKTRNMTEKEITVMTKSSNSKFLKSHCDFRNFFLLVLHIGVFAVSLWVHPIRFTPADRTLPYAM
ncbi:hypothetical protein KsCSTR_42970 [Candidatus Kuenenia stuttgartiensis]|uniref:Uncharacterized protein n=1 Tax=Kuenenia stuttgartiensis TaxID=174633 RepID=Q1PX77_KUEST|nr:hypothetical protein KsCSTR_42970 [Candidatus Kuenenia stuttgartiensis]CAJ71833.1 unknown protein [Candidatus Kuenenia stuttgartiensis]